MYIFNSMDAYLRPLVLWCLYTTINWQKKDLGEIEKYSQKNVYNRTAYNSFVCVCGGVWVCVLYLWFVVCDCIRDC